MCGVCVCINTYIYIPAYNYPFISSLKYHSLIWIDSHNFTSIALATRRIFFSLYLSQQKNLWFTVIPNSSPKEEQYSSIKPRHRRQQSFFLTNIITRKFYRKQKRHDSRHINPLLHLSPRVTVYNILKSNRWSQLCKSRLLPTCEGENEVVGVVWNLWPHEEWWPDGVASVVRTLRVKTSVVAED